MIKQCASHAFVLRQTLQSLCSIHCCNLFCANFYLLLQAFNLAPATTQNTTTKLQHPTDKEGLEQTWDRKLCSSPGFWSWIKVGLEHIHSSSLECHTQHNSTSETQRLSRQLIESFPLPQEKAGRGNIPGVKLFNTVSAYHSYFFSLQEKLQCKNLKDLHNSTVCKMSPRLEFNFILSWSKCSTQQ